jgi:hypothetical protein
VGEKTLAPVEGGSLRPNNNVVAKKYFPDIIGTIRQMYTEQVFLDVRRS